MLNKTPLYEEHVRANAKMVDFAGWSMPISYGSQIDEHHTVRRDAGMFDVSHMAVVDIIGPDARNFLQFVLANDVAKLKSPGKALYTCMLNDAGGVIDDLIVYYRNDHSFRAVVNAGTQDKDRAWLKQHAKEYQVTIVPRPELAIIAIQGPNARSKTDQVLSAAQRLAVGNLTIFQGVESEDFWIARTGYTGEDGYEIILPADRASDFWRALLRVGVKPCGLGARDTLRLEAGLNLYGSDMDESITPLEANLTWTIAFEPTNRNFIGRDALTRQKQQGVKQQLVGLILDDRGVLRNHQKVSIPGVGEGEITSGSFSPTMAKAIAFARIPTTDISECLVDMRGKWLPARVVKPPFVRNGKVII